MNHAERLKGIDVFVAAAEARSFTAAAEGLNLSASAVGKAIARLEERMGRRLFDRTTRRLALTDAGVAFHRICLRVLQDLESAENILAAEALEPSGRLRVDVPITFGQRQVLPLVLGFAQSHPAVRPHVSFTDRFVDVVDEGIDVAVRVGGPDVWPANLEHAYLGAERLVFCAAPDYLARRGTPAVPDDLARHEAVVYGRAESAPAPWLLPSGAGPVERRMADARFVVGHGEAQLSAVVAGCGIAQMATWLVGAHLEDGSLVQVLDAWVVDGLPLRLVWARRNRSLPKVRGLVAHLAGGLRIR